jgi:hypothetical protein
MDKIMKGQIGKTKIQVIEEPFSNAGLYVWVKPDGKAFTGGNNDPLCIESMRGDQSKIDELTKAAAYYGQPEGQAIFFPNQKMVSEETHSEQVDRMANGLIPSENDLGALIAAKQTIDTYGVDAYNA